MLGYDSSNSYRIYLTFKHRVMVSRLFWLIAAENVTKVDLFELEGTEHELDMMLDSPNLAGDEPTSSPPAVETASSEEKKEDLVDGTQKNIKKNLDMGIFHTIQSSEGPSERVMRQMGLT